MSNHLIKEVQVRTTCVYCKKDLSDKTGWESKFSGDHHYKVLICDCGKESWVEVEWGGSGHDEWDGEPSWLEEGAKEAASTDSIEEKVVEQKPV